MADQFLGEIRMGGWNFAPDGWAMCNGRLMFRSLKFSALFDLLGTTYGGDGQTTFGLPDLRSRVPAHQGSNYVIGELLGVENVTLTQGTIPSHSHPLVGSSSNGSATIPTGQLLAVAPVGLGNVYGPFDANDPGTLAPNSVGSTGGSQPHNNLMPYLGINFVIALEGIFPSQG